MKVLPSFQLILLISLINITHAYCAASITKESCHDDYLKLGNALIEAVQNNNIEKAKELLCHGADIEFKKEKNRFDSGRMTVEDIIDRIHFNVTYNTEGRTPLTCAVNQENKDMLELLINYRANINAQDREQETPLTYAIEKNENTEIISFLIAKGADIEKCGPFNQITPLMQAIKYNRKEMFTLLLDANANLENAPMYKNIVNYIITCEETDSEALYGPSPKRTQIRSEMIEMINNEPKRRLEEVKKRQLQIADLTSVHIIPSIADIISKYETHDYQDIANMNKAVIRQSFIKLTTTAHKNSSSSTSSSYES